MFLEDVKGIINGQEITKKAISKAIKEGSLGHAVLLLGPAGIGKMTLAISMAQALNCNSNEQVLCGTCSNCKKIRQEVFSDLFIIRPRGRWIKIEQLREVRRRFYFHVNEGSYRICIIQEAHCLTSEAAASLLKSLEEPASQVKYILTSSMPSRLLATIASRCVKYKLNRLRYSQLKEFLQEQFPEASTEKVELVANLSNGVPGKAVELFYDNSLEEKLQRVELLVEKMVTSTIKEDELLMEANAWSERDDLSQLLELLLVYFRDGLLSCYPNSKHLLINPAKLDFWNRVRLSSSFFEDALTLIAYTQKIITTTNSNVLLALETMFLRIKGRLTNV